MSDKAKLVGSALLALALAAWIAYRVSDRAKLVPDTLTPTGDGSGGTTRNGDAAAGGPADLGPYPAPAGPIEPGFQDAAAEAGIDFRMQFLPGEQGEQFKINLYDHGSGLAVGDYDGDGDDDVYFLNELGANALYRNRGDGTFERVESLAATLGLDDRVSAAASFADYDNDGDQDLYVTSTRGGNVLFRNTGPDAFDDATAELGLELVAHSQGAVFFDYDNDGDLDLFVANTGRWTTEEYRADGGYYVGPDAWQPAGKPIEANRMYRNDAGTFTDVTREAGLEGLGWAADAAVLDYDDDGRPDLYVTSMFGRNQLYHNEGRGRFRDVTLQSVGPTPYGALGVQAGDFDNDGRLDLIVADMHSDMWMGKELDYDVSTVPERKRYLTPLGPDTADPPTPFDLERVSQSFVGLRIETLLFGNALYRNLGSGKFAEISQQAGAETFWPWGIASGDFDNDGDIDLFVPSGMGSPFRYWPNRLLMNRGDGTFDERSREYGIEPRPVGSSPPPDFGGKPAVRSSRSAAVADFDGDGRLDLVVNNFNDHPYYYRNVFPRRNYVAFRLTGSRSNRDAIGALVRLHLGDRVMVRQVSPASGYLCLSSKTVHFGLGDRQRIDRVEIRWPSGQVQSLDAPTINRLHDIQEPP